MWQLRRTAPRRRRWILGGLGIACAVAESAVLILLGCGVDDHFPPLPNETPNPPIPHVITGGKDATGDVDGPSSPCECAAELYGGPSGSACAKCFDAITAAGQACAAEALACQGDPLCSKIITCMATSCAGADAAGIQACVDACLLPLDKDSAHVAFGKVLTCACGACGACTFPSPVSCAFDAGADG